MRVSPAEGPNLLDTAAGRRGLFAVLYVSEGAPIGFVWWAMPSLLREQGVELASITVLTSLATLPWVLKFLAAPVIDASLRLGAVLKHWIVVCQLAMASVLLPLVWLDWRAQFALVTLVVVAHAVFAAVQDVAIDTLAIHTVPPDELGRVNGWMQAGMLGGRATVAAGSALVAAAFDTPGAAVVCVAILVVVPAFVLLLATAQPVVPRAAVSLKSLVGIVRRPGVLAGVAVALLIGAGFEFFGVSVGPRLVESGGSGTTVAALFGLVAPLGLAAGALAGGAMADRLGVIRATVITLGALTVVLVAVALGDLAGGLGGGSLPVAGIAYFATGGLTASSYALFMTMSRGALAATRFSVFMAMTNACEAWAGFVGGRFAAQSYGLTLLTLALVACLAVLPLRALRSELGKGRNE